MNLEDFRLLYDYNSWANHRTLDACAALSDEQFTRDLKSSFGSVRDTLVHIFSAEWIWLERWHGRAPTVFPECGRLSRSRIGAEPLGGNRSRPARLCRLAHTGRSATRDFLQADLRRGLRQPLWQLLQHVANHSTYHRGQIATMLRQLGAKPISTDLILFYRDTVRPRPPPEMEIIRTVSLDEAGGAHGARAGSRPRLRAHDGRAARRPFVAGSRGAGAMLACGRFDFRQLRNNSGRRRICRNIRARSRRTAPHWKSSAWIICLRRPPRRFIRTGFRTAVVVEGLERPAGGTFAPRPFSRRRDGGPEAFRDRAAALGVFRAQGRAAGSHHLPDGARPESRRANRGLPDCARAGWPGALVAQRLFDWRLPARGDGALSFARCRAARDRVGREKCRSPCWKLRARCLRVSRV